MRVSSEHGRASRPAERALSRRLLWPPPTDFAERSFERARATLGGPLVAGERGQLTRRRRQRQRGREAAAGAEA